MSGSTNDARRACSDRPSTSTPTPGARHRSRARSARRRRRHEAQPAGTPAPQTARRLGSIARDQREPDAEQQIDQRDDRNSAATDVTFEVGARSAASCAGIGVGTRSPRCRARAAVNRPPASVAGRAAASARRFRRRRSLSDVGDRGAGALTPSTGCRHRPGGLGGFRVGFVFEGSHGHRDARDDPVVLGQARAGLVHSS